MQQSKATNRIKSTQQTNQKYRCGSNRSLPESALDALVASVVDEGVATSGVHADASHVSVGSEMFDHFFPVDRHVHLTPGDHGICTQKMYINFWGKRKHTQSNKILQSNLDLAYKHSCSIILTHNFALVGGTNVLFFWGENHTQLLSSTLAITSNNKVGYVSIIRYTNSVPKAMPPAPQ